MVCEAVKPEAKAGKNQIYQRVMRQFIGQFKAGLTKERKASRNLRYKGKTRHSRRITLRNEGKFRFLIH